MVLHLLYLADLELTGQALADMLPRNPFITHQIALVSSIGDLELGQLGLPHLLLLVKRKIGGMHESILRDVGDALLLRLLLVHDGLTSRLLHMLLHESLLVELPIHALVSDQRVGLFVLQGVVSLLMQILDGL